jgi:hypothetical protein
MELLRKFSRAAGCLEHFSNTRAVLGCVQGGFFLRKKPLGILVSL